MRPDRVSTRRPGVNGLGWALLALGVGLGMAWLDTRPHWDDTGVTAVLLLAASSGFGFARPDLAWATGLAVSVPIPIVELALQPDHPNVASLLAVTIGLLGAAGGAVMRQALSPVKPD
jgi:hypothetical protein